MGGVAAVSAASRFLEAYRVRCLAMGGACAGEHEKGDIEMYRLHPPEWKQRAEGFEHDPDAPWLALRPRSYEVKATGHEFRRRAWI